MMSIQQYLVALVVGYIFGNIPNGYLYAKSQGVDIYKEGSGNPGSTNISRTLGKRAGATVLLLDIAKTIVPILMMQMIYKPVTSDLQTLITLITGFGAVLGHDFPFITKLHGGKGIACTGALIIAFDWRFAIVLLLLFILVSYTTGYVSVGSIVAVSALFVCSAIFGAVGMLPFTMQIYREVLVIIFMISALAVWQHRANIVRLMQGKENKFHFKK